MGGIDGFGGIGGVDGVVLIPLVAAWYQLPFEGRFS